MSLPHIHLLLNHIPTIGFVAGLGLLLLALIRKNDHLKQASLEVLCLVALLTLPTYLSGYAARSALADRPEIPKAIVQAHADAALLAMTFMQITGLVAWLGLWQSRRAKRYAAWTIPLLVVLAVATFGLMAKASTLGGDIRHPEIQSAEEVAAGAAEPSGGKPGEGLSAWITETEAKAKALVIDNPVVWQVCETVHFIGLSFLLGVVVLLDLRVLGVGKQIPILGFYTLLPWAVFGYGLNTATGLLWVAASADQYMGNPAFYFKILWVVLAGTNALFLTVIDEAWALGPGQDAPAGAKFLAASSIFLWFGVLAWGRLMPFLGLHF